MEVIIYFFNNEKGFDWIMSAFCVRFECEGRDCKEDKYGNE